MSESETLPDAPYLVDRLYEEALALTEEARSYFSANSKPDRQKLDAIDRLLYTSESLRCTTRLMHVISWLMVRKAVAVGELNEQEGLSEERRLGDRDLCQSSDLRDLRRLPPMVASLSLRSQALYDRAQRMEDNLIAIIGEDGLDANPVAGMLRRLEANY